MRISARAAAYVILGCVAIATSVPATAQATTSPTAKNWRDSAPVKPKEWKACKLDCRYEYVKRLVAEIDDTCEPFLKPPGKERDQLMMKIGSLDDLELGIKRQCEKIDAANATEADTGLFGASEPTGGVDEAGNGSGNSDPALDPRAAGQMAGPGVPLRRGNSRGRNCSIWGPGFQRSANGRCELTRGRDSNVAKYERPAAKCVRGDTDVLEVPLPKGGTRTIRMKCDLDANYR